MNDMKLRSPAVTAPPERSVTSAEHELWAALRHEIRLARSITTAITMVHNEHTTKSDIESESIAECVVEPRGCRVRLRSNSRFRSQAPSVI